VLPGAAREFDRIGGNEIHCAFRLAESGEGKQFCFPIAIDFSICTRYPGVRTFIE